MKLNHYAELTLTAQRKNLRRFLTWCEARELRHPQEITLDRLRAFQRSLSVNPQTRTPRHPRTQAQDLSCVRALFAWSFEEGILLHHPALRIKLPKLPKTLPPQPLTLEELEQVLSLPDLTLPWGLRDRALLEVFYATAIRCAELLALTPGDLERERQLVRIRHGKGDKERYVPITERSLRWVERYLTQSRPLLLKKHDPGFLFISRKGNGLSDTACQEHVHRYLRQVAPAKAGACHLIRHSVATLMLENGCPLRHLQELLGHESVTTTQVYTHVSLTALKEAYFKTHPSLRPVAFHQERHA